jgi:dihydrofolate reductase
MTTSRSLISAMQVTLDGYSSPGDADWVDSWADGLDLLPPIDAFILGGGMFPDYERFWATILDDRRAASDILGRAVYPREVAYARLAMQTPHLVLSKTLDESTWPSASIVHDINDIRALRSQPGKAVYVVGGPALLTSLINEGLLDELHLIVHPVILGSGATLFAGLDQPRTLELLSAEPRASGRIHMRYRVHADAQS